MNKIWKFEDIVDLDYFSYLDRQEEQHAETDLHRRDRQIFFETRKQGELHTSSHRQCLLAWLRWRRHSAELEGHHTGPGPYLAILLSTGTLLLFLLGGFLGIGAGLSYFAYTGQTPLNVFVFFTIFILPQFLLLLVILLRLFLPSPGSGFSLLLRTLAALLKKAAEHRLQARPDIAESHSRRAVASLFLKESIHLFKWPLIMATQLFALAFNLGLAVVTLFKVATSDLAFGWQTTLDIGAQGLHTLVGLLALPWSWLLPDNFARPTLEQIEGSRIILKEGIYHLATSDLTSWWPFLFFCLLCYGLFPRILLLATAYVLKRRKLKRHLRQRRLYAISNRMLTPLVSTQAKPEERHERRSPAGTEPRELEREKQPEAVQEALLLVPVDIHNGTTVAALEKHLLRRGYRPSAVRAVFGSYDEDISLLEKVKDVDTAVIMVFEAWMAPIREQLSFLENLSSRLQPQASLGVCLIGRPGPERPLAAPQPQEHRLWRRKINDCCEGVVFIDIGATAAEEEP